MPMRRGACRLPAGPALRRWPVELANLQLAWDWALAHGEEPPLAQLCDGLMLAYEGAGDITGAAAVVDHTTRELSGRLAAGGANPALSQLHNRLVGIAVDLQLRAARPPREASAGRNLAAAGARAWRTSDTALAGIADDGPPPFLIDATAQEPVGEDGHPSRSAAARPAWLMVLPGGHAAAGVRRPGRDRARLATWVADRADGGRALRDSRHPVLRYPAHLRALEHSTAFCVRACA